ncbi:hypothetical protein FSP39_001848 [Pinctada imbricata]|uniref:Mitochondria-eating protein C-terminal domain-containing protein n=1 Tax=Pinctada imbricata TaxID=66713 RepID=A0AA88YH28_PINIB|nr:hypothetical protein FSP39_001848 [Pinctada imbricata]
MERAISLPESSRPPGRSNYMHFKPPPSESEPTYSSSGKSSFDPSSKYDVMYDDYPPTEQRLSRSLSSNSGNDCYEIPQQSWSPKTSSSSKVILKRSVSVNSAENQDSSPIMDLASSYRTSGRISEDSFQEIEREYNKLDRTKKNFSMKFSRESSMRLSTTLETKYLDDLPDDPKSSYYSIKRFLRTTRRDSLYQDAVNECAELVETEQRYCLAKSTNVNVFSSVSDVHGNVVLTRKQFEEMQNEITRKTQEADELTTRLSRMASQQMTEGNPNIADLSDRYRPTKIGEMFGQLYDDEWSEAYEALKEKSTVDEDEDEFQKDVLKKLVHVVKAAFDFSMEESEKQYCCLKDSLLKSGNLQSSTSNVDREMETFCTRTAKEVRKKLAGHCWRKAAEVSKHCDEFSSLKMYKERKTHSLLSKYSADKRLIEYIDKCMELSWYMSVQDPPMSLVLALKGDKMDTAEYCYHGKKGKIVDMCVWPSLHLHEGGPLVSKGYVLPQ